MTNNKHKCKNCYSPLNGNYCSNCGQKANEERFKLSNITELFIHGFYHVHGGVFYSIKELTLRPGKMLHDYLSGKRVAYVNPFTFLVLISIVGGFLFKWAGINEHIDEIYMATGETIKFTGKHLNYRILLTIPIYTLMCSIFYRSYKYNIAEHLVINTFAITQSMFFMTLWLIVIGVVKPNDLFFEIFYYSAFFTVIIYQIILFFSLFNKENRLKRFIKALTVVIIGLLSSFILTHFVVQIVKYLK